MTHPGLKTYADGLCEGRAQALREAAEIARNEEEPHPAEMPAEIIARVLAQDTNYVANAIVGAIRATKKNIAETIESAGVTAK